MVFVNKAAFDALPPEVQTAVKEAAVAAETRGWEASRAETEKRIGEFKASSMTVVSPAPEALLEGLREALFSATRTSCMICFILAGAAFLTAAMGYTGIPRNLAQWIGGFGLANWHVLMTLTLFFVVMGCFLDGISMVVLTTSIVVPMVSAAGFDLIWFGIFIVLVVEMAQITPPVGFNLYVLQALTGRNILRVGLDALPLFLLLLLAVVLLALFPQIALWRPKTMLDA